MILGGFEIMGIAGDPSVDAPPSGLCMKCEYLEPAFAAACGGADRVLGECTPDPVPHLCPYVTLRCDFWEIPENHPWGEYNVLGVSY
jgi:hypothetical protein